MIDDEQCIDDPAHMDFWIWSQSKNKTESDKIDA